MNNLNQKYIHSIFALKNFLKETFGEHIAYEIVYVIIIIGYPKLLFGAKSGHSYLLIDNDAYLWGYNKYGQLGLGHNEDQNSPQKLDLPNIKKIICGDYHCMAITNLNEIYVWGRNNWGQLGLGHNKDQHLPQKLDLP